MTNDSFLISGEVVFGPQYVPSRISISKERNLSREDSFCGGEDVEDLGEKNRDIHISGRLLQSEVGAFHDLLEVGGTYDIVTPAWSGEAVVKTGELEGPSFYDPQNETHIYKYSLDLVGTSASGKPSEGTGIIDDGSSDPTPGDRQLQRRT